MAKATLDPVTESAQLGLEIARRQEAFRQVAARQIARPSTPHELKESKAVAAEMERITNELDPLEMRQSELLVAIAARERAARQARIREAAARVEASAESVETSAVAFFDALRVFVEAGQDTISASLPDDRPTVARALDLGAVRAWIEQAMDDIQFPAEPAKTLAGNLRPERPTTTAQAVADVVE